MLSGSKTRHFFRKLVDEIERDELCTIEDERTQNGAPDPGGT